MATCGCDHVGRSFDGAYAAERLRSYRQNGPEPSTRALVEALKAAGVEGRTLLDIGGGVGAVQHELLRAGLASAVDVEASAAHADACREEAERQGHADRISHLVGDFETVADRVEVADIVTLDRSICCWADMPALVGGAAAKAGWLVGLVYPRDVWWVRSGWRLISNVRFLLRRDPMRVFNHRTSAVERVLSEHGLTPRASSETGVWQVTVFERAQASSLGV